MVSVLTADGWLYGVLSGDGTLGGLVSGVFVDVAPEDAGHPFVVMSFVRGEPRRAVGEAVIWWDEVWQVRAVDEGESYAACGAVVDRVRVLLDGADGAQGGGVVVHCGEVGSFRFSEMVYGSVYKHLGLELRLFTQ